MSMWRRMSERVHYFFEEKRLLPPTVRINDFQFSSNGIVVLYSFGRPSLVHRKELTYFEVEFYDSLSSYDKQWLIKARVLGDVYDDFFKEGVAYNKSDFLTYLKRECDYEKLF